MFSTAGVDISCVFVNNKQNTTDAAAPEKPNDPSPSFRRLADGIISYSIVSDHKHWMVRPSVLVWRLILCRKRVVASWCVCGVGGGNRTSGCSCRSPPPSTHKYAAHCDWLWSRPLIFGMLRCAQIAGRVRGVFPAAEACDPKGFVTRVKLLPVSPGLLALPRIKLFWRSRREDQEQHMHADNLTRGVQVRVNPGVQHNSPLHVALY